MTPISHDMRDALTPGFDVVERRGDVVPPVLRQRHFDRRVLASQVPHRPEADRHSGAFEDDVGGLGVGPGRVAAARVPRDADLHGLAVAHQLVADVQVGCAPEVSLQALHSKYYRERAW